MRRERAALVARVAAIAAAPPLDLEGAVTALIDAAGLAGETNRAALTARVARAALGYLRR
jgi:hypothetical protein